MAFQTSTLVNGQWTTTTLDIDQVLRVHNQKDKPESPRLMEVERPPILGLLTQTVIRSPLVHWILPVKLRDPEIQDVAFIGDDFVQIKELRPDGLLWDVIRKESFGARIRNAAVIGSMDAYQKDPDVREKGATQFKDRNDDILMDASEVLKGRKPESDILPPQFLLLQLQTGDSVFLMLRRSGHGKLEMVSSQYRFSKVMLNLQPGMHLAVDPSSRYMAIGCSEGVFAIYALHSRDELKAKYCEGVYISSYIEGETYIYLTGTILKMEFLYPMTDDDGHVILLALVVIKGKTRMLIWEWETGVDLKNIRARSLRGHGLRPDRQMPQLLIPLRVRSPSFIVVCEDSMSVCAGIMEGSPSFTDFSNNIDPPSECYHGSGKPLWASWTRPVRLPERLKDSDDIYIVREDGIIKILEVDPTDASVALNHIIGELETNCGGAFACLSCDVEGRTQNNRQPKESSDGERLSGDLLVTAGDSCTGGTYLVQARRKPLLMQPIQNWSPAQDFVTTYSKQDEDPNGLITKPDRVFTCGGKGKKGAITELRYGLEASIGLEMDYNTTIMEAWVLYPDFDPLEESGVSLFLLSMGDRSAVLRLSADAGDVRELSQETTRLDLSSRTVAAAMQEDCIIQVTERSIVLIRMSEAHVCEPEQALQVRPKGTSLGSGTAIYNAAIGEGVVAFTTYLDGAVWLQILRVDKSIDGMQPHSNSTVTPFGDIYTIGKFSLNVTGLSIGVLNHVLCVMVAERIEDSVVLTFHPLDGGMAQWLRIPPTMGKPPLQGIVSIAIVSNLAAHTLLLCGTRDGILLTLEIDSATIEILACRYDRVGATPAIVIKDEHIEGLFFVKCDSKLYAVTPTMSTPSNTSAKRWLRQTEINQVWLCDNARPEYQPPSISAISRMRPNLLGGIGGSMLLVAGTQLLIARLSTQPKAVPRRLMIECTPTRLMYSSTLQTLVVAASLDGRSTLLFVDPETGYNLSEPIDHHTQLPVSCVSGLGNSHERVFCMFEWSYTKNNQTWYYIIVATSSGRVLVISIENLDHVRDEIKKTSHLEQINHSNIAKGKSLHRSKIRYSLKHKFKGREPVTAAIGYPGGIIWCNGTSLSCEALSVTDKKFGTVGTYSLPSPGINLSYENDTIYVLTSLHSLEILKMIPKPGGFQIIRTHGDQLARTALHHTIIYQPTDRPIHLVSDKMCSLVGLWPTFNTKADTLEPVFEAQLPYSVLKFRFGRCRPIWDPVWTSQRQIGHQPEPAEHEVALVTQMAERVSDHASDEDKNTWRTNLLRNLGPEKFEKLGPDPLLVYSRTQALDRLASEKHMRIAKAGQLALAPPLPETHVINSHDNEPATAEVRSLALHHSELLGLSITGSLSQYTILDAATWELFRFLLDLAIRSPIVCEFTYRHVKVPMGLFGPVTDPKIMMHIDGDILKRCLELRVLEELLSLGTRTPDAGKIFLRFVKLLQAMHQEALPKDVAPAVYVEQAYEDLAFFLRPVM